jgi:hypothetical protein
MKFEEAFPFMRQSEMIHQLSWPGRLFAICDLNHKQRKPILSYAINGNTGTWYSPVELSGGQMLGEDWEPCGKKPD